MGVQLYSIECHENKRFLTILLVVDINVDLVDYSTEVLNATLSNLWHYDTALLLYY